MTARILIADDDTNSCRLFTKALECEGYQVVWAQSGEEALARLRKESCDVLVVDVRMPGMTGLEVTQVVRKEYPSLPVVVMTAFGSMETAIEAIHQGAYDYISKPMDLEVLHQTIARALGQRVQNGQLSEEEQNGQPGEPLGVVIGKSPVMVEVYKTVARVAPTKSTVLILGESGTGKELIARAIHHHSPRASRPFVAVDCGVLTETLLESELFGHVRGAFTGAVTEKKGVFEEAEGGTCFLDEIGDISPALQAKLLRVLQEHEIRRVGGKEWKKVDVRVVAATNRNLPLLVKNHTFRHDLYYRLNVISIVLPPLRERLEDIPALAYSFMRRYSRESGKDVTAISDTAMELLGAYAWPGNIRELENAIERAVTLARHSILTPEDFPLEVRNGTAPEWVGEFSPPDQSLFAGTPTLAEVNKRYLQHVLHSTQGNLVRAAKVLDIDRRSLYRMLERFKIAPFHKEEH